MATMATTATGIATAMAVVEDVGEDDDVSATAALPAFVAAGPAAVSGGPAGAAVGGGWAAWSVVAAAWAADWVTTWNAALPWTTVVGTELVALRPA